MVMVGRSVMRRPIIVHQPEKIGVSKRIEQGMHVVRRDAGAMAARHRDKILAVIK